MPFRRRPYYARHQRCLAVRKECLRHSLRERLRRHCWAIYAGRRQAATHPTRDVAATDRFEREQCLLEVGKQPWGQMSRRLPPCKNLLSWLQGRDQGSNVARVARTMLPRAQLYWRCMELPRIHTPSPTDTRVLIVDPCDDAGGGEANGRDGSRANGRDEQHGDGGGPTSHCRQPRHTHPRHAMIAQNWRSGTPVDNDIIMRLQHNGITTLLPTPCRLAWVARLACTTFTRRARATGALSSTHPCVLLAHQFDWGCRPAGRCGRTSSGWHLVRRKSQQTNIADLAQTWSSRSNQNDHIVLRLWWWKIDTVRRARVPSWTLMHIYSVWSSHARPTPIQRTSHILTHRALASHGCNQLSLVALGANIYNSLHVIGKNY